MPQIPRAKSFDSTLALLREPYRFIMTSCRAHDADLFETRILGRKTICLMGAEAAQLFYDETKFTRRGAAPEPVRATLFGKGGIQAVDGDEHRRRKDMFLSLMTEDRINDLVDLTELFWLRAAKDWESENKIELYSEFQKILTRAVCVWAGVPIKESEIAARARDLTAMFDAAGGKGVRHLVSRFARKHAEEWIMDVIQSVRESKIVPDLNTPLCVIAWHRSSSGELLDLRTAAIELLNVLRPTVAVSLYMVFVAHALHAQPRETEKLRALGEDYRNDFIQEVRRFYPFFPSIVAKVRDDFEWRGYQFKKGTQVILDIFGTNHDPRTWQAPHEFRPERFITWKQSPFSFIPQGGGSHSDRRCPGEWITTELMNMTARFLTEKLTYKVPSQDLQIDLSRLPAVPKSGFLISDVRLIDEESDAATFRKQRSSFGTERPLEF